jgi:indole-3-glycerol phosphate synthase
MKWDDSMSKTFLKTIVNHKKQEVELNRRRIPEAALLKNVRENRPRRSLAGALLVPDKINVIAEIKRASPSKGILNEFLHAAEIAREYEQAGAAAISVLTDSAFFKGSPDDLQKAKAATTIPILRKDFIVSAYQVIESAVMEADAILLIVRILTTDQLHHYLDLCNQLNLEALAEVHSPDDMKKALQVRARIVGINNRDLTTFETDITRALSMREMLSPKQIPVVASGIHSQEDIVSYYRAGLNNFLIGESLVCAKNPGKRLKSYLNLA